MLGDIQLSNQYIPPLLNYHETILFVLSSRSPLISHRQPKIELNSSWQPLKRAPPRFCRWTSMQRQNAPPPHSTPLCFLSLSFIFLDTAARSSSSSTPWYYYYYYYCCAPRYTSFLSSVRSRGILRGMEFCSQGGTVHPVGQVMEKRRIKIWN